MNDPTRKPYRLWSGPYRRDCSRVPPPGFFRRLWARTRLTELMRDVKRAAQEPAARA